MRIRLGTSSALRLRAAPADATFVRGTRGLCRFAALSLSRASEATIQWHACRRVCASETAAAMRLLLRNQRQWQRCKPVRRRCAACARCVCAHRCELSRQRLVLKPHQYHKFYSMETALTSRADDRGRPQRRVRSCVCVFFSPFLASVPSVCHSRQAGWQSTSSSCPLPTLRHPLEAWPAAAAVPRGLTTLSAFICMQIYFFELDSLLLALPLKVQIF